MSKEYTEANEEAHNNPALSKHDQVYCDYELRAPDATWVCKICGFENPMIPCWKCGSFDTYCFDERTHWFRDRDTGEDFEHPVGYFKCKECQSGWREGVPPDVDEVDDEYYFT